jgi:hypothetical protein
MFISHPSMIKMNFVKKSGNSRSLVETLLIQQQSMAKDSAGGYPPLTKECSRISRLVPVRSLAWRDTNIDSRTTTLEYKKH